MSWERQRDKWLNGKIQPEESKSDVENWLFQDPVWDSYVEPIINGGSHFAVIAFKYAEQLLGTAWRNDRFSIASCKGGKYVKKYQIKELVEAYQQIKDADATDQ